MSSSLVVSKKKKSIFIIISFILHLLLLYFFILFAFPKKGLLVLSPKKKLFEMAASLKPRKGSLHNNVFFDFSKPTPNTPSEVMKKVLEASTTLPAQKSIDTKKQENPSNESKQKSTEEKTISTQGTIPIKTESPNKSEVKIEKTEESSEKLSLEDLKMLALKNLLKKMPEGTDQQSNKTLTMSELVTARFDKPIHTVRTLVPIGVPGIATSKGFDLAERKGDDNKKPTFEDLKYVCYLRKIARSLSEQITNVVQNFNIIGAGKIEILFEIAQSGNLSGVEVMASSQRYVEALLVHAVKSSAPYPPIPKYFKKEFFFCKIELIYNQTSNSRLIEATLYALI